MTRRNFMLSAAALAGMPSLLPAAPSERRLRVGILSDIHVEGPRKAALFEKSLRYFYNEKEDLTIGVLLQLAEIMNRMIANMDALEELYSSWLWDNI